MNAVVAERGQVTIPKPLRRRMGIGPKTVLDFREEDGRLVAVKVSRADAVAKVRGCLRLRKKTDDVVAELRGES